MAEMNSLSLNGLVPHAEFPSGLYEMVHGNVSEAWGGESRFQEYSSAWNALAYRFHGCVDSGAKFQKSLSDFGPHPVPHRRFEQEQALFNFFSNGFAAFEAMFYGLFAVGSFIDAKAFPLTNSRERQRVSPSHTNNAFRQAFPNDPLLDAIANLLEDPRYLRWRELRNVLTHRAAPGRRIYVGIGADDAPPVEWKLNDLPLDSNLVPNHLSELAQLISGVLSAVQIFLATKVNLPNAEKSP